MSTIDKNALLRGISPPLDRTLAGQLLDEYVSQEKRFALGDWEPSTLDGGQFAEAASRIIYHRDSGNLSHKKTVDECLKYVEEDKGANSHSYPDRKSALHTAKMVRLIYKFRSDRGAVHINPLYTANYLDSKLIVEGCRWVLSEVLRLFWVGDRNVVAAVIQEIVRLDVPTIFQYDGKKLVQSTSCNAEEEILILLFSAGEKGMTRKELGSTVMKDPANVTRAIKSLSSPRKRQIVTKDDGCFILTDNGRKRVLQDIQPKLAI
jgi:hypothetical protein